MEPKLTAKQAALRDITADCQEERKRRKISLADPMGPQNCIPYEDAIRNYAGVDGKPDFRMFNGGHNKKPNRIYVTFHTVDAFGNRSAKKAVRCDSEEQATACAMDLSSIAHVRNVRLNRSGEFKDKNTKIISFEELNTEKL